MEIALALSLQNNSSSSSSSSAAAAAAAAPAAQTLQVQQQKKNDFKKKKNFHGLQPIQEQPILSSSYLTHSGCMEIMFNEDDDVVAHHPCPQHGPHNHPGCRDCANYEFMIAKRRHEIAEQTALERSLDNSEIVFVRSVMECSKHGGDFKQDCQTCIKICDLRDGRAC